MISSPSVHPWRPAACLRVEGPDAFEFLQGQFSNDLRELDHRPAVYGLWLNAKGRVLADSFILRGPGPGRFYAISYFSPAAVIRERLESYLVADDVTLTDETPEWWGYACVGLPSARPAGSADMLVFPGRRGLAAQEEWLTRGPREFPEARVLLTEDMIRARVDAGIPAVPAEIGPGELPQEGGLDEPAISYTKGCYLGQEVMARLKSMGQVRRQLVRVKGTGLPPAIPAALFQGDKKVGELRSIIPTASQEFAGLALVTLWQLDRKAGLSLAPGQASCLQCVEAS